LSALFKGTHIWFNSSAGHLEYRNPTRHGIKFGGTESLLYKMQAHKNKKWPSEVGEKIFGMPNHSREREPCNVPSPYPPGTSHL